MASGVNKVILVGNLGADPEVRTTPGGQSVANLRVATTEHWSDKDGNKQERTEWHSVTVWGRSAEHCGQYLSKGRQVYVEGRLQSREYEKDGVTRRVWDVVASNVVFLQGGSDSNEPSRGASRGGAQQQGGGGWGSGGDAGWGGRSSGGGGRFDGDPIPF
jgi:single-strand DNA-binding protein